VEEETADLLRKYDMARKCVVTSFKFDYIQKFREYAPEFRIGLLTSTVNDEIIAKLKAIRADELCPRATLLTRENVLAWRREGFRVRAWGVTHELMAHACRCGVDGMTVNFPDRLADYLRWTKE
jgi:glycerophosphoryl diester phosphodiesterase